MGGPRGGLDVPAHVALQPVDLVGDHVLELEPDRFGVAAQADRQSDQDDREHRQHRGDPQRAVAVGDEQQEHGDRGEPDAGPEQQLERRTATRLLVAVRHGS
jgi:hypothetical protein